MDIEDLNRAAWDKAVEGGENPYTQVVSSQQVADARTGAWAIQLSERRTVPREWFPPLPDLRVLCLAGGGGQQAPILGAAGAQVTLLDGSPRQLGQDAFVAERDGLDLRLVQGGMAISPPSATRASTWSSTRSPRSSFPTWARSGGSAAALQARIAAGEMFHFSHTMEAQLGGMIDAGSSSPGSTKTAG
jgi:hypothetical protein